MILRICLVGLFFISNLAYGHQDFYRIQDFGNVKVRIKTGFLYEEIKKAWIIGELSQKFCKQMRYQKIVFIDLVHHYIRDCVPDYFLSYDDGNIIETWKDARKTPILEGNALVIRQVSRQFSPTETLKLLEYAIANQKSIKGAQKKLAYHKNYCQWSVQSIDTAQVRAIATGKLSSEVKAVLNAKIYRQENDDERKNGISYYFQDNQYHLFYKNEKDTVLLRVDNVYQLEKIARAKAVVFDSDSSFYFMEGAYTPQASRRHVIQNIERYYRPFTVWQVGEFKVAFSFFELYRSGEAKDRIVLYKSDKDELIQDLDALLDKKRP